MVTELQELMRENVATPPPDDLDLAGLVADGRQRVRTVRRRRVAAGVAALATVAVVAVTAAVAPGGSDHADPVDHPPAPDAPTLRLSDAERAVEGRDYRELTSYTNENLDRDNGQYFDGVTDDGLVLFRDGPRSGQLWPRFALMDPVTGHRDWLPRLDIGQTQTWPVYLGSDRLVLIGADGGRQSPLKAYTFDRDLRQWSGMKWPDLPGADPFRTALGPDGRLYVRVLARAGRVPEGGWPTGSDGEAEDADAEGDTYHLWSVSMTDMDDIRDEGLTVGDFAFASDSLVWTDRTNGDAGQLHVRDLTTGDEQTFDPHAGARCNLLSFGAADDRIVMGEYCGTYAHGVRDDRVQILSTDGDQVVTVQDSAVDGALAGFNGDSDLVVLTSYSSDAAGTYVYDLGTGRFLRLSDAVGKFALSAPAPGRQVLWSTPVNHRHGATQRLGEITGD